MDASAKMESSSPVPSQPPARELRAHSTPNFPHQRKSSRPPISPTMEMPAMEEIRRPPIPTSRRQMELETIGRIVAKLMPELSKEESLKLGEAAEAAGRVAGISPKTEFIARLENGLFTLVLETYLEMGK